MEFNVGDIIVLVVVAIVLFIYRQLDRNSQSLAKVKRFTDKVRQELSGLVDSKTEELKNLTVELDVHMKTAKEILKRVHSIEDDLKGRTKGVDEIHRRIAEYDKALTDLVNMTQRVDENLNRLHDESQFVDTVGRRVKDAITQMAQIEKEIPELKSRFSKENAEQLKSVSGQVIKTTEELVSSIAEEVARAHKSVNEFAAHTAAIEATRNNMEEETVTNLRNRFQELIVEADDMRVRLLDRFRTELDAVIDEEEEKGQELLGEIQTRHHSLREEIDKTQEALNEKLEAFQDRVTQTEDDYQRALRQAAEKGRSLEDEVFVSLKEHVEARARNVEGSLSGFIQNSKERLESSGKELMKMFGETRSQITVWRAEIQKKMEESELEFEHRYEKFTGEVETRMQSILEDSDKSRADRQKELADLIESTRSEIDALEVDFAERWNELKSSIQSQEEGFKEELLNRFEGLDERVGEYEDSVRYRLDKVDEVHADIEALEESMKKNMDLAVGRAKESLQAAMERIAEDRAREKNHAEEQLSEIRKSMDAIDKELTELKSKAYANVSEKLQVFEDEFFTDLRSRDDAMRVSVDEWQHTVLEKIHDAGEEQTKARQDMEMQFSQEMKEKLAELQSDIFGNYERFNTTVLEFQKELEARMEGAEEGLEGLEERIKADMADIRRASETMIESELTSFSNGVGEQIREHRKEVDSSLRILGERVEDDSSSIHQMLESAKADMSEWQENILARMSETKAEVTEDFESFKESIQVRQGAITTEAQTENRELRAELEQTREIVSQAEQELSSMSRNYKEELSADADAFLSNFKKNVADMQAAANDTMRDFKSQVADVRGRIESYQSRLEGKIEDGYGRLSARLEEIDKKQRDFIGQTKLFERADVLKEGLERSIDLLKSDIARLDEHRTDLRDIEKEFNRVRKLGEDAAEKVARFVAEKRRIDSMDEDFKRLIAVSQSIDVKLEQVTSSHDAIQEVQVSLRELGELEGEVERRFDRLEGRQKLIDTTTNRLDTSFDKLETLQNQIEGIEKELTPFTARLEEIGGRIETLEDGKEDAQRVIAMLSDLEATLSEVEERIEAMQQARDWLARTETRLSEVSKQAEDQVKLMGSLLKEGEKSGKKGRGAPSLSSRDMVVRLAHQGWKVEQIVQATKLSQGEVELILELAGKK